jgi:hypothetical protein
MLDVRVPGDLISPFLRRAAELGQVAWKDQVVVCFHKDECVGSVLHLVLTMKASPEDLVELALQHASGYSTYIVVWCGQGAVPEHVVARLLRHPDRKVAEAAAQGEWRAEPQGGVRPGLYDAWRLVVVSSPCDFWIRDVFEKIPALAFEWLRDQLGSLPYFPTNTEEGTLQSAIGSLDSDARRDLLHNIPSDFKCLYVIQALVGDDLTLYQELLTDPGLEKFHLVPLSGMPDDQWPDKALMAREAHSRKEIIGATYSTVRIETMSGPLSLWWKGWMDAFEKLEDHPDPRI